MPHIVIVEDEASTSWALAEGLSDDGFTIDTFSRAEDALAWMRHTRPDLVITDLVLPGMSGLELARRVRRGRGSRPVIMVTAYGTPESLREAREAGVADCLTKPFPIEHLRRSVQRALEGGRPVRRRATRVARSR
jgi:DNA-binding response OmpR family regulator